MSENDPRNFGHGHVFVRPDGLRVRCGGPKLCQVCAMDFARSHLEPERSPEMCGHANEKPAVCPCSSTCYCKQHTCFEPRPDYVNDQPCQQIMCPDMSYCLRLGRCSVGFEAERLQAMTTVQPPPITNDNPAIQDLVLVDITQRKAIGLERYGTLLQAHNGRDMLKDAYEEAMDLCIYLRGALYERDQK